ncbi:hypothetical protein MTsPCn5_28700 [Croceitalea sp. MTPC5]|uniref:AAA family ATPase n=1 Tax=Croceitalea sp. MTPC5 TaxID=3056565 RepID=UPI002B3936A3|nr:hypothetical protein MTsPCn5_28700 [Croceitalea sp. MTPC5]
MELKYTWIQDYKNLKDIDFNFKHSSREQFSFTNNELHVNESKKEAPKKFFSSNITGITAIVGKNGSGKTNLSEFLTYNLAHVSSGLSVYMTGKGLLVLDQKIFIQENIEFKNENFYQEKGYEIFRYKDAPLDKNSGRDWHILEKTKIIYYCPIHSYRLFYSGRGLGNMINISTSYLMRYDVYDSLKSVIINDWYSWGQKDSTDSLAAHIRCEKIRESDIILNYSEIRELIDVPDIIQITIDHPSENNLLNQPRSYGKDEAGERRSRNYEELQNIEVGFSHHLFEQYKSDSETRTGFETFNVKGETRKNAFRLTFLKCFFRGLLFFGKKSFAEGFLLDFILDNEYNLEDKSLLSDLENLKKQLNALVDSHNWEDLEVEIIEPSLSRGDERDLQIYSLYRRIEIDTRKENIKNKLLKLISTTKRLLYNELHFHYEFFHQMSAGEQNLLNFYSRFYYAKKELEIIEKDSQESKGEEILIFIDEGEIAFHPEWQRMFFDTAITYLSNLFNERKIQLIFTTHSPFVLSDIPKENVIFMDKGVNGNAVKSQLNREQTFGANIYSLLSDSFFMDNGTIGEFAKNKIKFALDVLKGEIQQHTPETLEEVDYIIEGLGEPIIKQQLEIMRNNFSNRDKLSALEKKVQELEEKLRNESPDDND